jgi:LysR family hca operon transcriptional activator
MELRHLRYFIAVVEEGSLTLAAQNRLHTSQPSLSRQIRDLEWEVKAQLLIRGPRGIELTAAGRVFLDHARIALSQVETATQAARRAVQPSRATFVLGFLTGYEMEWLPEAMRLLRDELPNTEVLVCSRNSPELAGELLRGQVDVAFLRPEMHATGLAFKLLTQDPIVVVLRRDHRLASQKTIHVRDVARETFIGVPITTAPVLRRVVDAYAARSGVDLTPDHNAENLAMAISLVSSTRGVSLLPLYARHLLPPSVTSRPLKGETPTIDLVLGYNKSNASPLLKLFLSKVDHLISRVSKTAQSATSKQG